MKKRKINYRNLAILAGTAVLVLILLIFLISMLFKGCTGKQDSSAGQTTKTTENQEASILTIGDKKEGTEVNLDNQCGQAIVSFKVRSSDSGEFGDNLLGDNRIKNKSTARWYAESDNSAMNVEVKLANYTSFVLHDIPVSDFNGLVSIKYKDGVGYLEYKPKDSENTISTYQEELKYKDQTNTDSKQTELQKSTDSVQSPTPVDESAVTDDSAAYDESYSDQGMYDDGSVTDESTYDDGFYGDGTTDEGYTEDETVYDESYTGEY